MMPVEELMELQQEISSVSDANIGQCFDTIVAQLNLHPDDDNLIFLFSLICARSRMYGLAHALNERLCRTLGHRASVRVHAGAVCEILNRSSDALRHYAVAERDRAVDRGVLESNRATSLIKTGRYEQAIEACDRALKFDPDSKEAKITKGFALIELGELGPGWDMYEASIGAKYRTIIDYGIPRWNGESGARVILHGEQGIGDEIMHAGALDEFRSKYAPEAVAIDCDPKLALLFRRSFPGMAVYGTRKSPLSVKSWIGSFRPTHSFSLASLPVWLRRDQKDFPAEPRQYLKADPHLVRMYRALLESQTGKSHLIGIAWSGGTPETKSHLREIPVEAFEPLVKKYPNSALVSLQYRDDAADQIVLADLPIVHNRFATAKGPSISYEHTAALIAACDRVIATDTAVIHAAGAMGMQVDTLLSTPAMWVHAAWQKDRSAWYPQMRLHRRPENMDWVRYINHLASQGQL